MFTFTSLSIGSVEIQHLLNVSVLCYYFTLFDIQIAMFTNIFSKQLIKGFLTFFNVEVSFNR